MPGVRPGDGDAGSVKRTLHDAGVTAFAENPDRVHHPTGSPISCPNQECTDRPQSMKLRIHRPIPVRKDPDHPVLALQQHPVDGLDDSGGLDATPIFLRDDAIGLGFPALDGLNHPIGLVARADSHHKHHSEVVAILPTAPALRVEHVPAVERVAGGQPIGRQRPVTDVVEGGGEHDSGVPRAALVVQRLHHVVHRVGPEGDVRAPSLERVLAHVV